MLFGYFTERPYRWVNEDEVLEHRGFFALPNSRFDREKAADDYNFFWTNTAMPKKSALMPSC